MEFLYYLGDLEILRSVIDNCRFLCYNIAVSHRRTVHRSVGDRRLLPAGRLSDKMSSELGITLFLRCRVFFVFLGGYYEGQKSFVGFFNRG